MASDALVAGLVVVALSVARFGPDWEATWLGLFSEPWAPLSLYAIGWVTALYMVGAYRLRAQWTLRTEVMAVLRAAIWTALAATSVLFFVKSSDVSRLFLLVLFPVQAAVTITSRAAIRLFLEWLRLRGRNARNILILGTGARALAFAAQVEGHSALGLRVAGFLGDDADAATAPWPYLGPLSALERAMHEHVVDEVAICLPSGDWSTVESLAAICEEEGKVVRIPLEIPPIGSQRRFVEDLDGTAILSLVRGPDRILALAVKRLVDILASALALGVLSPVFLVVALTIRLRDGSPVLYRQTRIGENGRAFSMLKFRTMVPDADAHLTELMERNEMQGQLFKITDDPRITPLGRVLRRFSLDELPQLWNVLKGDMSLVGPRPPLPWEVAGYDLWHRRKLSMKPGITGLQQVEARRDPQFDNWVSLDLRYIDQWSLWLDIKIALQTVPAVLRSEGR
jgi:exopolysaccharide biosynthesis polyprenyl glycosylphosphotransferase